MSMHLLPLLLFLSPFAPEPAERDAWLAAIRDAATIDDLPPADIARARKNLEDAPLTAAAVAAGSIKLRQVVDEAEARSYETALRPRSAQPPLRAPGRASSVARFRQLKRARCTASASG